MSSSSDQDRSGAPPPITTQHTLDTQPILDTQDSLEMATPTSAATQSTAHAKATADINMEKTESEPNGQVGAFEVDGSLVLTLLLASMALFAYFFIESPKISILLVGALCINIFNSTPLSRYLDAVCKKSGLAIEAALNKIKTSGPDLENITGIIMALVFGYFGYVFGWKLALTTPFDMLPPAFPESDLPQVPQAQLALITIMILSLLVCLGISDDLDSTDGNKTVKTTTTTPKQNAAITVSAEERVAKASRSTAIALAFGGLLTYLLFFIFGSASVMPIAILLILTIAPLVTPVELSDADHQDDLLEYIRKHPVATILTIPVLACLGYQENWITALIMVLACFCVVGFSDRSQEMEPFSTLEQTIFVVLPLLLLAFADFFVTLSSPPQPTVASKVLLLGIVVVAQVPMSWWTKLSGLVSSIPAAIGDKLSSAIDSVESDSEDSDESNAEDADETESVPSNPIQDLATTDLDFLIETVTTIIFNIVITTCVFFITSLDRLDRFCLIFLMVGFTMRPSQWTQLRERASKSNFFAAAFENISARATTENEPYTTKGQDGKGKMAEGAVPKGKEETPKAEEEVVKQTAESTEEETQKGEDWEFIG